MDTTTGDLASCTDDTPTGDLTSCTEEAPSGDLTSCTDGLSSIKDTPADGGGDKLVDLDEGADDKESGFEDGSNLSKSNVMTDSIIRFVFLAFLVNLFDVNDKSNISEMVTRVFKKLFLSPSQHWPSQVKQLLLCN